MRSLFKILVIILVCQMITLPVSGQNYRPRFEEPLGSNPSSGMSFRKKDMQNMQQMIGKTGLEEGRGMIDKGALMTEPSLSGLVYQVHILGEVKTPGTFRITASDRLSEVMQKSGGVNDSGSEREIEIRRQGEATKRYDLLSFQLLGDLADNPYLLDNDVVFVPLRRATVNIVGAVMRPREYELKNEKTLADAIKLAGGFSVGVAREEPINVVRFADDKKEIIKVASNGDEFTSFKIEGGDTIYIPNVITEKNTFDYNVPKLPGDNIFYPSFEDRVFILGGVQSPGAYDFNPYYTLPQYLSLAGGLTTMSTNKMNILSPEGKNTKITKKNKNTIIINPGDTVVVGVRRVPPEGWVTLFMSIATFALSTTATVLALQKN